MPLRRAAQVVASLALSVSALACDGPTNPTEDTGPRADAYVPPGVDASLDAPTVLLGDAPSTGPMSPLVDPMCLDGQYREALPNNSASLADLTAGFTSAGTEMFVQDVLTRRYPFGWTLVDAGRGAQPRQAGQCLFNPRPVQSHGLGQKGVHATAGALDWQALNPTAD